MIANQRPSAGQIVIFLVLVSLLAVSISNWRTDVTFKEKFDDQSDTLSNNETDIPESNESSRATNVEETKVKIEPVEEHVQTETYGDVRVENIHLSGEIFYAGEPVDVEIILRNYGNSSCLYNLSLLVSGVFENPMEVELEANETVEVYFTIIKEVQGGYILQADDQSTMYYVVKSGLEITDLQFTPSNIDPGESILISVNAYNPNYIKTTDNIRFQIGEGDPFNIEATVDPRSNQTVTFNTTMFEPGWHYVWVRNNSGYFEVKEELHHGREPELEPTRPKPTYYWVPDPATDNFTNILPPEASPVRLVLPAPIEDIFFDWRAGTGGYGLHAGGHIEGLDHVWIEIRTGIPVRSWGDGVVTGIQLSGDIEHGEYHIYIDYGQNLTGSHMEIATPLVEVGDNVSKGDPIGYGMSFFSEQQSAEFTLMDWGRTDGIWLGDGVAVSPYDYLEDEVKIDLVEAYKSHTIDKYRKDPKITWLFDAVQPYLTNPLLIHMVNKGKLTGEWYLISSPWEPGWPNDMLIFIETDNPWCTDNRVLSNDDTNEDSQPRNIEGTFQVDYERGRVLIYNHKYGGILFGIFELDETEERAILKIEFHETRYPEEFTDEAMIYIERTNLSRRRDATELGVLNYP
jgi:hypothetical protein